MAEFNSRFVLHDVQERKHACDQGMYSTASGKGREDRLEYRDVFLQGKGVQLNVVVDVVQTTTSLCGIPPCVDDSAESIVRRACL